MVVRIISEAFETYILDKIKKTASLYPNDNHGGTIAQHTSLKVSSCSARDSAQQERESLYKFIKIKQNTPTKSTDIFIIIYCIQQQDHQVLKSNIL